MIDKTKKIAMGISGIALAIAMGAQTFVFGKNDLQTLKDQVAELSLKLEALEGCCEK